VASRQRYEVASGVLVTEMRAPGGVLRVTDALTIRKGADLAEDASASRSELIRSARVLDGQVELLIEVAPWRRAVRGEGGEGMVIRDPDGDIHVWGSQPLQGLRTLQVLEAGEEFHLVLR
jgi:hypothetical protein